MFTMLKRLSSTVLLGLALALATPASAAPVSEQEAYDIGIEAYVYLYPLISMEVTRRVTTNLPAGSAPGFGPMNAFHHMRAFPTADFRAVVRPNFDTLYSSAWLDLSKGPMIVSAPNTNGRYYLLPMLDMWSDVFAVPGKRTSGTEAGHWAVVPKGWSGRLPQGVERIESPTHHVWIIGRTQTNGPQDYPAVHQVQEQFRITPLAQWGSTRKSEAKFVADPSVDMKTPPLLQVDNMPVAQYFAYGAALMKTNPPHPTDWSQIERMKRIGIEAGKPFALQNTSPAIKAALERARTDALSLMREKAASLARMANGWQMNTDSMGVYGNFYLKRAIVAQVGLGANQPEDAIYPLNVHDADGKPLDGANRYVLHFAKGTTPPNNAFWSITMYDAEGFQVANPLNRFAIGDRDALKYNADGSLDIYIQHQSPGADKEANWLPAPASGRLGVTMRIYAPKAPALDGRWNPPAIQRAQ